MNYIVSIDPTLKLIVLGVAGLFLGSLVNLLIYRLAWRPRPLSPWMKEHPRDGRSVWLDRIPVIGWWRLRRKSPQLGRGFWIRPMVIEIMCGLLVAGLHIWEVYELRLIELPVVAVQEGMPGVRLPPSAGTFRIVHAVFGFHVLLLALMLVASFIDIDERVIPDSVTVPGTLIGLFLVSLMPRCLLPGQMWAMVPTGLPFGEFISLTSPLTALPGQQLVELTEPWPPYLHGFPQPLSIALALACFWAWCAALLPRLWLPGRGFDKAVRMFLAHAARSPMRPTVVRMAIAGTIWITAVWLVGGPNWAGLLTSLVGMAVGGGLVWGVRVMAGLGLRREAMGFGDVTLMAMIGVYVGWQATVLIFFLSPFPAVVIGVLGLLLRRGGELPFGPYLCAATLGVILAWRPLWARFSQIFALGWVVLAYLAALVVLLGVLLAIYRLFLGLLPRRQTQ